MQQEAALQQHLWLFGRISSSSLWRLFILGIKSQRCRIVTINLRLYRRVLAPDVWENMLETLVHTHTDRPSLINIAGPRKCPIKYQNECDSIDRSIGNQTYTKPRHLLPIKSPLKLAVTFSNFFMGEFYTILYILYTHLL